MDTCQTNRAVQKLIEVRGDRDDNNFASCLHDGAIGGRERLLN